MSKRVWALLLMAVMATAGVSLAIPGMFHGARPAVHPKMYYTVHHGGKTAVKPKMYYAMYYTGPSAVPGMYYT